MAPEQPQDAQIPAEQLDLVARAKAMSIPVDNLIAQGYSPERAAVHPANPKNVYARLLAERQAEAGGPSERALREGARLVAKAVVVHPDGYVITSEELGQQQQLDK